MTERRARMTPGQQFDAERVADREDKLVELVARLVAEQVLEELTDDETEPATDRHQAPPE